MFVIKHRKIFLIISSVMTIIPIILLFVWGLKPGIDFVGGSILEVSYPDGRPDIKVVQQRIDNLPIGNYSVRPMGENSYVARTKFLNENERVALLNSLSSNGENKIVEEKLNSIGPTIGQELKNKAYVAILLSILFIVLFIAFAFRKVSKPVSSWKYGVVSIMTLAHDILIPTGVFLFLSKFAGAEIDVLFITALLAILGYSINDTIIVFDRIRENLNIRYQHHNSRETFEETIGKSLGQTYGRSFNTSFTTFLTVLALYIFGGSVTQNFALVLMAGVIAGTYSSIFIAAPLLLLISRERTEKK